CARARRVAEQLVAAGARVVPDPPHTNMMHAAFPVPVDDLLDASAAMAKERGVTLVARARAAEVPGLCSGEITIGEAAAASGDEELQALLTELVDRASRRR